METKAVRGVSGSTLKWIAVVSMLIDHAAVVLVYGLALARGHWGAGLLSLSGYRVLRAVGRPAFPIFCFLLAEGFVHTRSRGRYLLRLLIFAALSELPFDLALRRSAVDLSGQNVFFTLALGLAAAMLWDRLTQTEGRGRPWRLGLALLGAAGLVMAGRLLKTDYGAMGVLLVLSMILLRSRPWLRDLAAAGAMGGMILFGSSRLELWGLTVLPLLHLYNGRRGRQSKYFFYAFYPAHLLLLRLLGLLLIRI